MLTLNKRQLCDLELILNGGFNPLTGFMNEHDYSSCVKNMTLSNGTIWPIPIVLSTDKLFNLTDTITLKDETGVSIANMVIESIYKPNLEEECEYVLGSTDSNHPYHDIIMENTNKYYIGGTVTKICSPLHYDFVDLRMEPAETKNFFKENNWDTVIGFQTRNPLHRSHFELTKFALNEVGDSAKLLLHPVVGITQDCDIDYHTRVRCYKKLLQYYPADTVKLAILPLSMRMAGPREALLHAIIRRNYGCTHFIVGRDHAGPSYKKADGKPFYGPYDAHTLLTSKEHDIGIKIILSPSIVYVKELNQYMRENEVPKNMTVMNISGTQQREMLLEGSDIPEWFSWSPIINELRTEFKLLNNKGLCVYLVGLSGSGKSTIANVLIDKLKELNTGKKITLLDADVVRLNLSKGLGFSKEDRSTNVRRIGYVAAEIVKHGGIVICANIAPYEADRLANRKQISQHGQYIEVFMKTSLDCCERRDVKGLYKLAKEGKLANFTGISDPFEEPTNADLVLDGDEQISSIENNLEKIINRIKL
jgi:sulfate adenylyltransferase